MQKTTKKYKKLDQWKYSTKSIRVRTKTEARLHHTKLYRNMKIKKRLHVEDKDQLNCNRSTLTVTPTITKSLTISNF